MVVEDSVPIRFYVEAVFFLFGGCCPTFIFEKFVCEASMVFLEAIQELAGHLPGSLRVGVEVFLLAFFSEFKLPCSFGSSFFSEKVSSGFCEGLLELRGPYFFMIFLLFIPFGNQLHQGMFGC